MGPWASLVPLRRRARLAFLVALAAAAPVPGSAQSLGEPPPQGLRHLAELQLLGGSSSDGAFTPSVRATLQRRLSLGSAVTFSGLFLQDDLSHTGGLALGYARSLAAGPLALEPFAEVGAGLTDARVSTGSYTVAEPDGTVRTLERYAAVEGSAFLGGAGVSLSGLIGSSTSARLTVGYWHQAAAGGLSQGSVRFGLSLGVGWRDARWYDLATDRTPPMVVVQGTGGARPDSVSLTGDALTVLSADANGVARLAADGRALTLETGDRTALQGSGLPEGGVSARYPVSAPFGGTTVVIVARDSAGLETSARVRAFGPPDRDAPVLTVVQQEAETGAPVWPFRILAEDYSGIAEARLGVCSVPVGHPAPVTQSDPVRATTRVIGGWGGIGTERSLAVTDRSGNVARLAFTPASPDLVSGDASPELRLSPPIVAPGPAGSRSVFVGGAVRDPAGGWVQRVTVAGAPAGLRVPALPYMVEFGGWVTVPATETSVLVEAATSDGRTVRQTVDLGNEERARAGRLHVVIARPSEDGRESWEQLATIADEADRVVLLGAAATPDRVVDALVRLQQRAGPDDVVLVHVAGTLTADSTAVGPSLELSGGELGVAYLSRLVRALTPAAALLSYDIAPGFTWQVPLTDAPGGPTAPGCLESGDVPSGRGVVLGAAAPGRLFAGLSGEADRNADGIVTVFEVLDFLGVSPPDGLVSHRPDAVAADPRRAR